MERDVLASDGTALFVVELGPEEGPPLVVLHGGPAAHHDYLLPGFAALADERHLVLYDQRGGGRSRTAPGADLGFARHLADLEAILDALALPRVDLVGYSFGGLLALVFAARRPGRVGRLVLASSVPPRHGWRAALEARLRDAQTAPAVAAERDALERSGLRERLPAEYRRRRFALSIAGYLADPRLAHAVTPFHVQARAAEAMMMSLGAYDFRGELASVDGARTMIVHGAEDPLDPATARETAALLGCRFELLPACGHVPFVEAPGAFFAILRRFLGGDP